MAAADLLPHDVLEEILRRLAPSPRSLAACRVVCKAWRAVADTRCPPPRPDLLPLSLAGIFFASYYCPVQEHPGFFARRGRHHRARIISPKLDYLDGAPIAYLEARDHCNGLLLMCEHVVNPATRAAVGAAAPDVRVERPRGAGDHDDHELVGLRVHHVRPNRIAALRGVLRPPTHWGCHSRIGGKTA
uniref:F-box domain-containing protein n=1 Tax=Oryza glumipatula TaxID=40148 RepID=A0A0E0B9V6_9ORYZ